MWRSSILTLVLTVPFVAAQTPEPETEPAVFRSEVSLITVDAKVTGRTGGDVGGLNASDFVVFDEGQEQKVSHFGRESTPIDLLLVLDVSRSMRPFLIDLTPRVTEALSPLRPGDRAGVMLFADNSELVQPLTSDLALIPRTTVNTIYKDGPGRSTLLNQALVSAAHYLQSQPATGRRTIIVLTDNYAVSGKARDEDVIRELHAANAVLNIVMVGAKGEVSGQVHGYRDPSSSVRPDVFHLAGATGGRVMSGDDPARALHRVIQEATTRYSLQYPAPGGEAGKFRAIRVELSPTAVARHPGAVVRARSGYDVPK